MMQIEESTYAAVITGQTIESGTSQDGRKWERLRLYVDVCRGVSRGYFSLQKQEYPNDRYKGVVDTYYAPEGTVLTDTQQQQLDNNIAAFKGLWDNLSPYSCGNAASQRQS